MPVEHAVEPPAASRTVSWILRNTQGEEGATVLEPGGLPTGWEVHANAGGCKNIQVVLTLVLRWHSLLSQHGHERNSGTFCFHYVC
jgi:hypothetical protein